MMPIAIDSCAREPVGDHLGEQDVHEHGADAAQQPAGGGGDEAVRGGGDEAAGHHEREARDHHPPLAEALAEKPPGSANTAPGSK